MTVMVILATMVVPRMSGIQSQRDITAIDAVASMVASFAFHDSTGGMPVALTYNDEMRQLRLLVLEPNGDSTPGRATWRIHPFNRPVPIPEEMDIVSVTSDGEPLSSLRGHYSGVNCCAWRGGGAMELYTAGSDGLILAWTPPRPDGQAAARMAVLLPRPEGQAAAKMATTPLRRCAEQCWRRTRP